MKFLTLLQLPVNGSRSPPIILMSPWGWGTCCSTRGCPWGDGGYPPPPLPPGFPPGPLPPGFLLIPLFQACLMLCTGLYRVVPIEACTVIVWAVTVWDIVVCLNGTCSIGSVLIELCWIVVISFCLSCLRSSSVSVWGLLGWGASSGFISYSSTSIALLPT